MSRMVRLTAWDVQGTSSPPEEDKMYDQGLLSEAKEGLDGQGLAPAAASPITKAVMKIDPQRR